MKERERDKEREKQKETERNRERERNREKQREGFKKFLGGVNKKCFSMSCHKLVKGKMLDSTE